MELLLLDFEVGRIERVILLVTGFILQLSLEVLSAELIELYGPWFHLSVSVSVGMGVEWRLVGSLLIDGEELIFESMGMLG